MKQLALLILLAVTCQAGEVEEVKRIAAEWQAKGIKVEGVEVRQWDYVRVDLLTDTHAYEADWPHKWAEAIGQALYYAELTGRKPGIILLVRDIQKEGRYVYRCQTICAKYGIKLVLEAVKE